MHLRVDVGSPCRPRLHINPRGNMLFCFRELTGGGLRIKKVLMGRAGRGRAGYLTKDRALFVPLFYLSCMAGWSSENCDYAR